LPASKAAASSTEVAMEINSPIPYRYSRDLIIPNGSETMQVVLCTGVSGRQSITNT
jgi:hypothetical protein